MIETKVRILDAAERLIADQGLDVSLRAITTEAGVNLAAVNYHFQSKDTLVDAVVARRIEPINRARLERLDAIERDHPSGPLPLEPILRAFLAPTLEIPGRDHLRVLFGRLYSSPEEFMRRLFHPHLRPLALRFQAALARAVPALPENELIWCLQFTVGVMVHTMAWSRLVAVMTNGVVNMSDSEAVIDRIVRFAAAGYRAAEQAELCKGARHA